MQPPCPVCTGDGERRYQLTDYDVHRCRACGQQYIWPLPDEATVRELFRRLYTGNAPPMPELASYYDFCFDTGPTNPLVQLYERWLAALEQHRRPGRLLDIGCGTGLFLHVARRRGWETLGVDECEEALAFGREQLDLDLRAGTFEALLDEGLTFDAITMWDIIEHTRTPVALLAAARRGLAPGGILGVSTPNVRNVVTMVGGAAYRMTGGRVTQLLEKFYIPQHFVYFDPTTLAAALARADLAPALMRQESTDLARLTLVPPMRLALRALFAAGRLSGRQTRLFSVATARA